MLTLTWVEQFREVGISALIANAGVALAFIVAYFVEVRPLVRAKESGDPLAEACAQRADVNISRFVWIFAGLQAALTTIYMIFFQSRGYDDGYLMFVFFPSFLIAYSSFLFYRRDYYARLKEVITKTGTPVLVDLNRHILDKIFIWQLELVSAAGVVTAGILYFEGDISVVVVSVVLFMWYASIRTRKYMVKQGFSYWYKSLLVANLFAQALKLQELYSEYRRVEPIVSGSSTATTIISVTALVVILQLVLALARLPGALRSIQSVIRTA